MAHVGEDAVDVTYACIKRGVPINAIIAAQSGATAPATPAGFLAQSLAETLASLVLVNMIDFGMNVQEAGDAARIQHSGSATPTGRPMATATVTASTLA